MTFFTDREAELRRRVGESLVTVLRPDNDNPSPQDLQRLSDITEAYSQFVHKIGVCPDGGICTVTMWMMLLHQHQRDHPDVDFPHPEIYEIGTWYHGEVPTNAERSLMGTIVAPGGETGRTSLAEYKIGAILANNDGEVFCRFFVDLPNDQPHTPQATVATLSAALGLDYRLPSDFP